MANTEPEGRSAAWRKVAAVACSVRYIETPVEATTAGWWASKPASVEPRPTTRRPTRSRRGRSAAIPVRRNRARRGARASTPAVLVGRSRRCGVATQGLADAARTCRARRRATRTGRHPVRRVRPRGLRRTGRGPPCRRETGWSTPRSMSGRARQSSPGATRRNPTSSSSTWGGASTRTCMARHSATRTAVLSGSATSGTLQAPQAAVGIAHHHLLRAPVRGFEG